MATSLLLEDVAIVQHRCPEKNGPAWRSVYPMRLTPQNMKIFWEKAREYRIIFGQEVSNDFQKFAELLVSRFDDKLMANGLFWRIDDFVGVYYMTEIKPDDAQIHYTFFDRRHHGRVGLTRLMLKYVFTHYGFHRLSAEFPQFAGPQVRRFVEAIGMKQEGIKRAAIRFDRDRAGHQEEVWSDAYLYGILAHEALSLPVIENENGN